MSAPAGSPRVTPIGLHLSRTARAVSRAFDDALAGAGGSQPIWLVLISLKMRPLASQRQLAEAVGIREATLTHHLNAMESRGLVTRTRDPANRRMHVLRITEAGEEAFLRLRSAAMDFDARLRAGLPEEEVTHLRNLLDRLEANASRPGAEHTRPAPGTPSG